MQGLESESEPQQQSSVVSESAVPISFASDPKEQQQTPGPTRVVPMSIKARVVRHMCHNFKNRVAGHLLPSHFTLVPKKLHFRKTP